MPPCARQRASRARVNHFPRPILAFHYSSFSAADNIRVPRPVDGRPNIAREQPGAVCPILIRHDTPGRWALCPSTPVSASLVYSTRRLGQRPSPRQRPPPRAPEKLPTRIKGRPGSPLRRGSTLPASLLEGGSGLHMRGLIISRGPYLHSIIHLSRPPTTFVDRGPSTGDPTRS